MEVWKLRKYYYRYYVYSCDRFIASEPIFRIAGVAAPGHAELKP